MNDVERENVLEVLRAMRAAPEGDALVLLSQVVATVIQQALVVVRKVAGDAVADAVALEISGELPTSAPVDRDAALNAQVKAFKERKRDDD